MLALCAPVSARAWYTTTARPVRDPAPTGVDESGRLNPPSEKQTTVGKLAGSGLDAAAPGVNAVAQSGPPSTGASTQAETGDALVGLSPEPTPPETFILLPARPAGLLPARAKFLKMTVGVPPTTGDLGSEADTLNPGVPIGEGARAIALSENWSFVLKGYLRAPMRVGYGQNDASVQTDTNAPNEFHSLPRMVGASSSNWAYINIAPNPTGSLRATVSNARVAATIIVGTNQFTGVGYPDLDSQGGLTQAFMTLKFPETFGQRGGIAWTFGAFGNRYGYAGPKQVNSGYYGTYLFGRTRVMGEAVTANIDLTDHLELLVEHGFGAEMDILPILGASLEKQMFIPGDPHAQLGSNFVHHAHVALWIDDWLKVAGHYLTSWTPNDRASDPYTPPKESRLTVVGGEVHLDHPRWGSGYLGYSHVSADNLLPLNDALQVIHGGRGYDFKLQYFGNKLRNFDGSGGFFPYDGGRVETILFQHKFFSNQLFRRPIKGPGAMLGVYGMFAHSYSPPRTGALIDFTQANVMYGPNFPAYKDNKLKYGIDLVYAPIKNLSLGFRYDRVQPTSNDPSPENPAGNCPKFWSPFDRSCGQTYMALTPYVWIQPDWNSTRRITVSYTRYILGDHAYPDSPYSAIQKVADANLFMISALMSL
jgi:hypothetical protein